MVKRSAAMFSPGMAALRLTMAPNPQSHAERTSSRCAVTDSPGRDKSHAPAR